MIFQSATADKYLKSFNFSTFRKFKSYVFYTFYVVKKTPFISSVKTSVYLVVKKTYLNKTTLQVLDLFAFVRKNLLIARLNPEVIILPFALVKVMGKAKQLDICSILK